MVKYDKQLIDNESFITFVIPVKNEEENIEKCLLSILTNSDKIKIVTVDNGSEDHTVSIINNISNKFNDRVTILFSTSDTVSGVRNLGARYVESKFIWFLDGDIVLDRNWINDFCDCLNKLIEKRVDIENIVTGSNCRSPNDIGWIAITWNNFINFDSDNPAIIYSANLIISNELFRKVGGFDENFITGEDEKLCNDCKSMGAKIISCKSIHAFHYGYPKTLVSFFRRALWHGSCQIKYLRTPWKYKDLVLSLYYYFIFLLFLVGWGRVGFYSLVIFLLFFSQLPIFLIILKKKIPLRFNNLIKLIILLNCYSAANAIALLLSILKYISKSIKW